MPLFADDKILHKENNKDSTKKKLLKLIDSNIESTDSIVVKHKTNIQNSVVLYILTINYHNKRIKKAFLITMES